MNTNKTFNKSKNKKAIATIALVSALVLCMTTAPAMAADFWQLDSDIVSGLPKDLGEGKPTPVVFCMDGTWYLIAGNEDGTFNGFNGTGSAWVSDSAIVSGLGDVGWESTPEVSNKDGTWYLIAGENSGIFNGFNWTGSGWQSDPAIVSGLGDIGLSSSPEVFYKDGTWYLLSGEQSVHGIFHGYNWTGSAWQSDPAIASGLEVFSAWSIPEVFNKDGTWYSITSGYNDAHGYNWTGSEWQSDPAIASGYGGINHFLAPAVFNKDGIWYLISGGNYAWHKGEFYGFKHIIAPDLTPTSITAPELFVNQSSTITATIENIGVLDASAFNVSLSADGAVVNTTSVLLLNVSESTTVSFEWTPASGGDINLCVVADPDNAIEEMKEDNNETCIMVTVSEIPEEIVWWYLGANIPFDAERLPNNNTLIADHGAHLVIEVTPAGEIEWQYGTGTEGSDLGQLSSPLAAKRLSNNNTLITDYANERVIEVNSSGAIMWQYGNGTPGSGPNQLDKPRDAERLENGNTLITDRLNNRVIEVNTSDYDPSKLNNGFTEGSIMWQMTGLNHPADADRLENGNTLIVVYKDHTVIEINPDKEIVWQYGSGTDGSGVNQLNYPEDAERLSNGNTLVADRINNRVIEIRTSDYDPTKPNNGFTTRSIVWEYECNSPPDAERLENGNTLICEANRVIEVMTPPAELKPSTPFVIFGEVKYDCTVEPVQNLTVTVENVNTTEEFDVDIYVSENRSCYQVLTASGHVLAGDVLHFVASNDNVTDFDYTVTDEDMNHGGFVQNITIICPVVPMPDLTITAINAYHNNTRCPAWFNLSNEIDVTVKNIGTAPANESNVSLYIEDEPRGKLPVPGLDAGEIATVTFENWMPVGEDCLLPVCDFELLAKYYNFTGVADCDNDVEESDENNEITVVDRACYNGYMADEPLENVAHGLLKGRLNFTTGDGIYSSLYSVGDTQVTNYEITIPEGATVELAHLNVYYTWCKPQGICPEMEVSIQNGTGTYVLPLMKAYNDVKCTCPGASWILTWGNYVYDLTDYVTENGTYTVTVENVCTLCDYFCPAAPGIVLVYEDENAPQIEYWINEGADVLMGGRRYPTSSNLAWWENINNATFQASTETDEVLNVTLGVVSPWGGSGWEPGMTNYLFFNDVKIGTGVYHGYGETYKETIDSISMFIGSTNAQIGVNVTDVTALYLNDSDNVVGQCDDGDNMMPANAFLVVEYEEERKIPAGVRIEPETLNLGSKGEFTAYITLSEPYDVEYDVADINVSTVECEGARALSGTVAAADNGTLVVKFDRINLSEDLPTGEVEMTVTGKFFDGTAFVGSDTVTLTHGVEPTPSPTPTPTPPAPGFWVSDSKIVAGLQVLKDSAPTVFCMDGTWYLISGVDFGEFHGFKRGASRWVSDSGIVSGLPDLGHYGTMPEVFCMNGTWYMIAHSCPELGGFYGFKWTGSAWVSNSDMVSGLAQVNTGGAGNPTVFNKDGTWYLMVNEYFGDWVWRPTGYSWTGSAWQSDPAIVSGLEGAGYPASTVYNRDGTWYLIAGSWRGRFSGYNRTGSAWQSDPAIVSGLPADVGEDATPEVFYKDGNWYLISGAQSGEFYGFMWQES